MQTKLRARTWVALVILVAICLPALFNAPGEWRAARTTGQRVSTVIEVSYGLAGILAAIGVIMRRSWTRPAILAWAVLVTATASLASRVWGGAPLRASLVSAVACGLIATVLVMLMLPSRLNPNR
jgi:hypothetical protein